MNIFRKTALLALCAALSLPLAACAGGGDKEPVGTSGAVTSDASAEITENGNHNRRRNNFFGGRNERKECIPCETD